MEFLLLWVGLLTFVTGFGGEDNYEMLKVALIQSALPVSIFLFSWSILFAIYMNSSLDRLMWRQLGGVGLIVSTNVIYYGVYDGQIGGWFYYVMWLVDMLLLVYYIYFFSCSVRKYKVRHPHACTLFRWLIDLEKFGLYGMGVLSVIVGLWPDKRTYMLYTLLYTLFFIVAVLVYHNHEVRWALHLFVGKYKVIHPVEENIDKVTPMPVSSHAGNRQSVLNNDKIAEKVEGWVDQHGYREVGITIKKLSKELGINRTYLSNFINEMYGTNFNGWVNELRVEESKKKMCESPDLSLSEVADFVGFADSAHFSKQFKQKEGISPSVWRKNKTHCKEK